MRMIKKVLFLFTVFMPLLAAAQHIEKEPETGVTSVESDEMPSDILPTIEVKEDGDKVTLRSYYEPLGVDLHPEMGNDSITLSPNTSYDYRMPMWHYPLSWDEWCGWGLHKGLNISIGASVFGEFGKHARHGAGFAQSISALYVTPLTDRLSLAVGGYMNNVYWAHDNYRDAGVSALLNYRINDHWEAFVYGKKSLLNDRIAPRPVYDMHALGDVVGGGVRYNFTPSFSMEVSVNYGTMPTRRDSARDVYHNW